MPRKTRVQSLMLVLAVVVGIVASGFPANAAPLPTTASVNSRDVLSGSNGTYQFTLVGPGGTSLDPKVNWVRIGPKFLDSGFTLSVPNATGWSGEITSLGQARFRNPNLQTRVNKFNIDVQVPAVPEDTTMDWVVEVSDDNGKTITKLLPTAAGQLTTAIKTLQITNVAVAAPGTLADRATQGQAGVHVTSTVFNYGSVSQTVTPSLSSSGTGDTISEPTPANASIAPNTSQTFDYTVVPGTPGVRTFTAGATAPGSSAATAQSGNLTVETPADFSYKSTPTPTLAPTNTASGQTQTFTLALNKTNPPSVTFTPGSTVLTFTKVGDSSKFFSTTLSSSTPETGRGAQTVGLTFDPIVIPGDATYDGTWTPSLTIVGVDDNAAPVTKTVAISTTLDIDNLVPVVVPTLSGPSGQTDSGGTSVVKNGDKLDLGGPIKRSASDSTNDLSATVTTCDIYIYNSSNVQVNTINVPMSATGCRNNAGSVAGSITPAALGTPSGTARAAVAATDVAGNASGVYLSAPINVDNIAPTVANAVTGCGAEGIAASATCADTNTIRAYLTEGVNGQMLPLDFMVANNLVSKVDVRKSSDPATACTSFCDVVVLTLSNAIDPDATPSVRFEAQPLPPNRAKPSDGPKNAMGAWTITPVDGIVPDLPTLTTVTTNNAGTTAQGPADDGNFYTNFSEPTFHITGLGVGYTSIVALDTNGDGDYQVGDEIISTCEDVAAAEIDCGLDEGKTLAINQTHSLLVTSRDAQDNLSMGKDGDVINKHGRPYTLIVDQTNPTILSFTATPAAIALAFSENLVAGRDEAQDWTAFAMVNGHKARFVTASVTGTDAARTLSINDTDYTGTANGVIYDFDESAPALDRYRDAAGNELGDFTLNQP